MITNDYQTIIYFQFTLSFIVTTIAAITLQDVHKSCTRQIYEINLHANDRCLRFELSQLGFGAVAFSRLANKISAYFGGFCAGRRD